MPNTRNAEIKNQMIRMQEELLLDTRKLLDQALHFNEYAVRQQNRYDRLESENAMMKYKLRKLTNGVDPEYSENDKEENFYGKPKN